MIAKKILLWSAFILVALYIAVWCISLGVRMLGSKNTYRSIEALPAGDTVVVFGGLHYKGQAITEINQERLQAAKNVLSAGKAKKIVVSNAPVAAKAMSDYLGTIGVPKSVILLDAEAYTTIDTCRDEILLEGTDKKVIFVTEGYHIPRVLLECHMAGLEGVALAAETASSVSSVKLNVFEVAGIRFSRLQREAWLTAGDVLVLALYGR